MSGNRPRQRPGARPLALRLKRKRIIEVYEIPHTTTIEAIMDKISEAGQGGQGQGDRDMRDETDLNGLTLAIDLKRGVDPTS